MRFECGLILVIDVEIRFWELVPARVVVHQQPIEDLAVRSVSLLSEIGDLERCASMAEDHCEVFQVLTLLKERRNQVLAIDWNLDLLAFDLEPQELDH